MALFTSTSSRRHRRGGSAEDSSGSRFTPQSLARRARLAERRTNRLQNARLGCSALGESGARAERDGGRGPTCRAARCLACAGPLPVRLVPLVPSLTSMRLPSRSVASEARPAPAHAASPPGPAQGPTFQEAIQRLQDYWSRQGCAVWLPHNTEVGAGTMNPATFLRVLGPEPWNVAYAEPSIRPDDSRYGDNPNRVQRHTQYQVILKPDPGNSQELFLGSLEALGIDTRKHDVRFVEDNWESPALGAWGLGWEVWLDGMEVTQARDSMRGRIGDDDTCGVRLPSRWGRR